MTCYTIRTATPADLDAVLGLRAEAEQWLAAAGIRQWTPDYDGYARSVLTGWVGSGAARVVEHAGEVVGTVAINDTPDLDFWGWADDQDRALYLGKMMVRRDHAGRRLGDAILNWAAVQALAAGRAWLRLDVRRDNRALQRYYLDRRFHHVRTWHRPGRRTESGWLAQRISGTLTGCGVPTLLETRRDGQRPPTHATSTGG